MATAKKDHDPLATKVAVIMRSATRPGLKRCGNYDVDRVHTVPVGEAQRLVVVKGFSFASAGDAATCKAALEAAAMPSEKPTNGASKAAITETKSEG